MEAPHARRTQKPFEVLELTAGWLLPIAGPGRPVWALADGMSLGGIAFMAPCRLLCVCLLYHMCMHI